MDTHVLRVTSRIFSSKYASLIPRIAFIVIMLLCINASNLYAQSISPANPSFFSEDFWQKVTIAIISAILALVSSYLIFRANERSKPRAQVSYNIDMDRALSPFKKALEKDTQVLFRNSVVQNLFQIKCMIRNTGNTIVRQEEIRFSFGDTAKILNFSPPDPEEEIGLSIDDSLHRNSTDRRISISSFPKQREMIFDFVVDGERPQLQLYARNDKEDVDFVAGELRQIRYDEDILKRFFIILALFIILPGVGSIIPISELSGTVAGFTQIVLLVFLVPLLPRASQILAHRLLQMRNEGFQQRAQGRAIVIGNIHGSSIELRNEADRDDRPVSARIGSDVQGSSIEIEAEADRDDRLAAGGDNIG